MKLATLCYIKHQGKTLMVHRNKKENDMHEGKWNGVGGKFEQGETPEECVIREVKEETGLDIHNPHLHGVITFPGFAQDDWYVFIFSATTFSGELIEECPEGELRWIADDAILDLNLWSSDPLFFKWMKQDKLFSARFTFNEDESVKEYSVVFY